ncbi:MAG: hypothetical protein R2800_05220 [Flavipsychrobacter sp.]
MKQYLSLLSFLIISIATTAQPVEQQEETTTWRYHNTPYIFKAKVLTKNLFEKEGNIEYIYELQVTKWYRGKKQSSKVIGTTQAIGLGPCTILGNIKEMPINPSLRLNNTYLFYADDEHYLYGKDTFDLWIEKDIVQEPVPIDSITASNNKLLKKQLDSISKADDFYFVYLETLPPTAYQPNSYFDLDTTLINKYEGKEHHDDIVTKLYFSFSHDCLSEKTVYHHDTAFLNQMDRLRLQGGYYELYTSEGKLMSKGGFANDKPNGIWEYYEDNRHSRDSIVGKYTDGLRDSIWVTTSYFKDDSGRIKNTAIPNSKVLKQYEQGIHTLWTKSFFEGKLKREYTPVGDGSNNWAEKRYNENGALSYLSTYDPPKKNEDYGIMHRGKEIAPFLSYDHKGDLSEKRTMDDKGVITYQSFSYENQTLSYETKRYKDSVIYLKQCYPNGNIQHETTSPYKGKQITYKGYYESGELKTLQVKNKKTNISTFKLYYKNGKLKRKGHVYLKQETGTWKEYDKNGKRTKQWKGKTKKEIDANKTP